MDIHTKTKYGTGDVVIYKYDGKIRIGEIESIWHLVANSYDADKEEITYSIQSGECKYEYDLDITDEDILGVETDKAVLKAFNEWEKQIDEE